jgi:hypothetical protein
MHCFPIKELRIFDVAHVEDRGRKLSTLLSMDIDGVRVYSLPLPRVVKPASCQNTVAMFNTEDRRSICAWLDPVSKECFVVSEMTFGLAFYLCHMAALVTGACAAILTHDRMAGLFWGVGAAAVCGAVVLWQFKKNADMKTALRTRYRGDFTHPAINFLNDE